VTGIIGDQTFPKELLDKLFELCKTMSTKEAKMRVNDSVKFDFKIKGQKPVVTKGVMQVSITGAGFDADKIGEFLTTSKFSEL